MRGIICFGLTAGQFYHRDMYIEPYSGDLDLNPEFYYSVRVPGRGEETEREREREREREFFARLYHQDWSLQERQCLYAGKNQGGDKESGQSDPVRIISELCREWSLL